MSAERTSRAAVAAEQLCAALWEALHERLGAREADEAAALGERIADVSRAVSALARAELGPRSAGLTAHPTDDEGEREDAASTHPAVGARSAKIDASDDQGRREAGEPQGARAATLRSGEPGGASLIDERQTPGAVVADEQRPAGAPIAIRDARGGSQDARGGPAIARGVSEDARGGSEIAPWHAAVQRRLDRYREDRDPFAVLLVELVDAERLRIAQSPAESERQLREVEAAIVEQLRPADALVRELDGRYWLIAPDSSAADARAIAGRLASAARRSASHRGAPLQIAVGIALCPENGLDVGALTGHAEVDLYAAQAAGQLLSDPDGRDPAA